ncbi:MAG: hypothetical protein LBD75_07540 [Candidatus Peribacteria bacterium]|jgi:hypothetical protein|nr:hypothetical protein [Candidatus Peribacteria bacterium]
MFNQIKEVSFGKMLKNVSLTMFLEMMTRQIKILKAEFGERLEFEEVKTFHFNIRIVKVNISSMLPLQ